MDQDQPIAAPSTDPGTLPAEALALVTGIFPRHPPTVNHLERAAKLHNKAEAAIKAFLKADGPDPMQWERPPAQDDLRADLTAQLPYEEWVAEHVPFDIWPQWLMVVDNARKFAIDKWPVFDADGLTPEIFALAADEYGDEWEIVRTIDGAENFFADLKAHVLSPDQVAAFRECYPEFYKSIDLIMFSELAGMLAKKKTLTWQQEDMVRVFRGLPEETPVTVKATEKPQAPSMPVNKPVEHLTTNERIETREMR